MASPHGSETGSFDHGVKRFSRLFSDQVKPRPDSVARKPKRGLATTFVHGAGGRLVVVLLSSSIITYSRPSAVKPPSPLKNLRCSIWDLKSEAEVVSCSGRLRSGAENFAGGS